MFTTTSKRLQVVYVSSGYPGVQRPDYSVFIHRSVKLLSRHVDVNVIHIQAWRPGRPMIVHRSWEGVKIVNVAIPHYPSYKLGYINSLIMSRVGYPLTKQYLQDADLIHSTSIYPMGYIANHWAKLMRKAHVTQAIGRDVNIYLKSLSPQAARWLSTVDGISCNSSALQEQLRLLLPALTNSRVIYRGVDTSFFSPQGDLAGPQAEHPSVKFLYLGGFQTWDSKSYDPVNYKGGHVLLDAWPQVEADLGLSSLIIGGAGLDLTRLEAWRAGLLKPDSVYIQPLIKPEAVPGFLRSCDVLVMPSISDGLPNLANEAQACGRPVLGTDAGGIPETVAHGETGYIVRRNDAASLAQGMRWFYMHQNDMLAMGAAARQRMVKLFSWESFVAKMLDLYQASIEHHTSKA